MFGFSTKKWVLMTAREVRVFRAPDFRHARATAACYLQNTGYAKTLSDVLNKESMKGGWRIRPVTGTIPWYKIFS